MPSGGGSPKDKKNKKKSKEQLEREKKRTTLAPVESMTFEVIKPKRKERDF